MDAATGKALGGVAHLKQSIRDILTTPIGSRVMRRDYGARLFELVDRPVDAAWRADAFAYTAEALDRWEPRIKLTRVILESVEASSRPVFSLEGQHMPEGQPIKLEGIVL